MRFQISCEIQMEKTHKVQSILEKNENAKLFFQQTKTQYSDTHKFHAVWSQWSSAWSAICMSMQLNCWTNKMTESTRQLSDHLKSLHWSVGFMRSASHPQDHFSWHKHIQAILITHQQQQHRYLVRDRWGYNLRPFARVSTSDQQQTQGRTAHKKRNGAERGRVFVGTSSVLRKIQWVRSSAVDMQSSTWCRKSRDPEGGGGREHHPKWAGGKTAAPHKRWATSGARLHAELAVCVGFACGWSSRVFFSGCVGAQLFENTTSMSMTVVVR